MIQISGSIARAFTFPAIPHTALDYYSDLSRVVQFMPHISLVCSYQANQIRVLYQTEELGSYTINIYSDLEMSIDWAARTLQVYPVNVPTAEPVITETNMRESTGHGLFAIEAAFSPEGEVTRVEYSLRIQAKLQRPLGMRLMPKRVVSRIAQGIADNRTQEIADGFVKHSVHAFPMWQAQEQTIQSGN